MRTDRRLTSFSHGAGCGCKLGPEVLGSVLGELALPVSGGDLLVASETGDDAAVHAMPGGGALVATVDVFTPIVDDAYDWGRIAAANALSDVYAMGGSPKLALNVAAWPVEVEQIIGRAWLRYWPIDTFGILPTPTCPELATTEE